MPNYFYTTIENQKRSDGTYGLQSLRKAFGIVAKSNYHIEGCGYIGNNPL